MWQQHQHITYEFTTNRIHNLREEERHIQQVYKKLWKFRYENTIFSINNDIIEYLQLFIREEQMKQSVGVQNEKVIGNLEKIMTDFISETELCRKLWSEQNRSSSIVDTLTSEQIFPLVSSLYQLPITGQTIREQVDAIQLTEEKVFQQRDIFVQLPTKAGSSQMMRELENIMIAK
jgi:hypothetical protein